MPLLTNRPVILKHFNTNIYDDIGAVIPYGSPTISNTQQRFAGKNSVYTSTGNPIYFVNDDNFNLGTGDFTISFSEYLTSAINTGCSFGCSFLSSGYASILFGYINGGNRYLYISSDGASWNIANAISLGTVSSCLNVWVDWELSRKGNTFYVFKNSILVQTFTSTLPIYYNKSLETYYGVYSYVAWLGTAYMCEFLVTKECLHTASFTPNTEPYTVNFGNFKGININIDNGIRYRKIIYFIIYSILNSNRNMIDRLGYGLQNVILRGNKDIKTNIGTRLNSILNGNRNMMDRLSERLQNIILNGDRRAENNIGNVVTPILKGNKNINNKIGYLIEKINDNGIRSSIRQGIGISLIVDSNASYKFDVIVTPTHQYKSQTISVFANSKLLKTGRWSFVVGSNAVMPFSDSQNLNNITFNIDNSNLSIGTNYCKLLFQYNNGLIDFIPLIITKEAFKRSSVSRTFNKYDGGYNIVGNVLSGRFLNLSLKSIEAFGANTNSNLLVTTTDYTNIDLNFYKSILGIIVNGNNCNILISFDKRQTWYAHDGTKWVAVLPSNILVSGMTVDTLNNLTSSQLATIFQPTQLDFMINTSSGSDATTTDAGAGVGDSWGYATKLYTAPVGKYITKLTWVVDGGVNFARIIIYDVNNNILYDSGNVKWNTTINFDYSGTAVIGSIRTYASGVTGGWYARSQVTVTLASIIGYVSDITVNLPLNMAPTITNVTAAPSILHSGNAILSAIIADPDDDEVQYQISINDVILDPWTAFAQGPITLDAIISADTCSVGTNSVVIEATDGDRYTTYETFITRTNDNPTIVGILSGRLLTATLGDANNDTVKYRILLNGIVKEDWGQLVSSPADIRYVINRKDILSDQQNSLIVEVEDELGGTGACTFDFVGKQYKKKSAFVL